VQHHQLGQLLQSLIAIPINNQPPGQVQQSETRQCETASIRPAIASIDCYTNQQPDQFKQLQLGQVEQSTTGSVPVVTSAT
jgi:hypothetical protein